MVGSHLSTCTFGYVKVLFVFNDLSAKTSISGGTIECCSRISIICSAEGCIFTTVSKVSQTAGLGISESIAKLNSYLAELNEQAKDMFFRIVEELAESELRITNIRQRGNISAVI